MPSGPATLHAMRKPTDAPKRRGRPSGTEYRKIDVRLMPAPLQALTAMARENGNTVAEEARQAIDAHVGLAPVRGIVPAARKGSG